MSIKIEQTSQAISSDRWNWEISLKGKQDELDKIEFVEYTLHPTFFNPVRKVYDRATGFKLKTSGWGTFPVYYRIKLKGEQKEILDSLEISFDESIKKELAL